MGGGVQKTESRVARVYYLICSIFNKKLSRAKKQTGKHGLSFLRGKKVVNRSCLKVGPNVGHNRQRLKAPNINMFKTLEKPMFKS